MPTQRPRAVFFDLDDTLFDYRHAARAGLRAAARLDAALAQASFADLEATHLEYVEQLHPRVLRGELTYEQARAERFRRLLVLYGGDPAAAHRAAECFAGHLRSEERLVPGAAELLARLAAAGVRLGIISNNTRAEQIGKLERLGCLHWFAGVTVSGDHGISKPDARLFGHALASLGAAADESVHVGDSWDKDVAGALGAGLRAVWFNRHHEPAPGPGVPQLRCLSASGALEVIMGAACRAAG